MKSEKKLSVIVPVYNVGDYLRGCIESISAQTYENLEIILVDDGSKDKSGEICDEYAAKDARIKVIHKENGGVSSARNAGLDASTGEYIAFVDGDDVIDADTYEFLVSNLEEYDADISRCGIVRETGDLIEAWGVDQGKPVIRSRKEGICDVGEANGILPVSPCNKVYKRSVIGNVRFDTRFTYAEDTLFNYLAAKNAERTVIYDKNKYHYISNPGSASHRSFSAARFDEHRVTDIIMAGEKDDPETYKYCVKGDVMKSFRTIKEMTLDSVFPEKFGEIRKRITDRKKEIFRSGLYSRATKAKTLLLWLCPPLYRLTVRKLRG